MHSIAGNAGEGCRVQKEDGVSVRCGAGEMAQLVQWLSYKLEDLSLIPSTHIKPVCEGGEWQIAGLTNLLYCLESANSETLAQPMDGWYLGNDS